MVSKIVAKKRIVVKEKNVFWMEWKEKNLVMIEFSGYACVTSSVWYTWGWLSEIRERQLGFSL